MYSVYNTFFSNKKDKSIAIHFLAITIENTKQNLHCKLYCIAIPSAKLSVCLAVTESVISLNHRQNSQLMQFLLVVKPCSSSPCLNSGVCRNTGDNYRCICTSRYTGTRCERRGIKNNTNLSCLILAEI